MNIIQRLLLVMALVTLGACAPEVGTEAWCKNMADKDKADWSTNEALDYAKHCAFD